MPPAPAAALIARTPWAVGKVPSWDDKLGDTKLAIRYLEESIKHNPNFIYSYIKLYYIYLNKKNKEKTQYYLNKSNELFLQTSK